MQGGRAETEGERAHEKKKKKTDRQTENKEFGFNPARLFFYFESYWRNDI